MPPYGYYPFQRPPPPDDEDLSAGYENVIRGRADPRQLGLMRFLRPGPGYGPSQGIAGPVPRGTARLPDPSLSNPQFPYEHAMTDQEPEMYGPPEVPPGMPATGPPDQESHYRKIVEDYLQSLLPPYRLPEPAPYSRREKLGLLAAREPWQREMIVSGHREPYERAMAEAQIRERRRGSAANLAADLEKAQQYEKYRLAKQGQPSQQLDYVDKVEKAQADAGNADYPYTRRQWKALAEFKAQTAGNKLPGTKEQMLKDIDANIRAEEDQMMQGQAGGIMGEVLPDEYLATHPERRDIVQSAGNRRRKLIARRNYIANLIPDDYRRFRNLTADDQERLLQAYESKMEEQQKNPTGQLGPVAPAPQYYP